MGIAPMTPTSHSKARTGVNVGDFIVCNETWRSVERVVRVTGLTAFVERYGIERRTRLDIVIFSGPEDVATRLHQQLVSSAVLEAEDRSKAFNRRQCRDQKFIESALASLPAPQVRG